MKATAATGMKIVGSRRQNPGTPAEYLARATVLQAQLNRLSPFPRPRSFVFKAKTWEEFDRWRNAHANPRLWRKVSPQR